MASKDYNGGKLHNSHNDNRLVEQQHGFRHN
jgi:hypothetical protein